MPIWDNRRKSLQKLQGCVHYGYSIEFVKMHNVFGKGRQNGTKLV
jgi:hypothetical protein